jgi:Transposase DDE domain
VSLKVSKAEKAAKGLSGFVPAATWWVIECSNAWMEGCKNLVKNFEWTLKNAGAKIKLCFIRLMVKCLAVSDPNLPPTAISFNKVAIAENADVKPITETDCIDFVTNPNLEDNLG